MSNYEELRAKNIADNKRILAELGLLNPVSCYGYLDIILSSCALHDAIQTV